MRIYTLLLFMAMLVVTSCQAQVASAPATANTGIGDTVTALDKTIFIIHHDKKGNYWFGSDGEGVYRYNGKTILHFTTKHGLSNNRIREIKEDKYGNIFFTTLNGISKFDGRKFTTLLVTKTYDPGDGWKLEKDDMWFKGEPGKNGPYRYDGQNLYSLQFAKHYMEERFSVIRPKPPYSPYELYYIYKDRTGTMWFGTGNLGICRYDGKSHSWLYEEHLTMVPNGGSFGIRSIIEDKQGAFWFCNTSYRYHIQPGNATDSGKVLINYTKQKGIEGISARDGDKIYFMSVVEDKEHNLWMSTYADGVWKYDGKTTTRYPVIDGTKEINVFSIYQDNSGTLWLGTHAGSAYKFNGQAFEKFQP